ncbi:MAG: GNAT family N-acetyltransferase [Sediminibacterium sp.]|nr:GNAT family N-acetyltransferase [Sediminibacterium sp.]
MQPIKIREATKNDCPAMLDLIKELALYEKAPSEVTVSLETFENAGFGINPIFKAWVVELEQNMIGLALTYIRYSTWKGPQLFLEDLVVSEKYRNLKIGKKLFETVLEYAKVKNYTNYIYIIDFYLVNIPFILNNLLDLNISI